MPQKLSKDVINFFENEDVNLSPANLKKLKSGIKKSQRRMKKAAKLLAKRSAGPLVGDLYWLPTKDKLKSWDWAIIHRHPDNPKLFFAVPADNNPYIGITDVSVPDEELFGLLSLRCGFGLWVHEDFLVKYNNMRYGFITTKFVKAAMAVLAGMVSGNLKTTLRQEYEEELPELVQWRKRVARNSCWLEEIHEKFFFLNREGLCLYP